MGKAQTTIQTDSVRVTLVELTVDTSLMNATEQDFYAQYFINQLRNYISPVMSYKDQVRRLNIIGRMKQLSQTKDSIPRVPSDMPEYYCRVIITAQNMAVLFDELSGRRKRLKEVFMERKGKNDKRNIRRLASATIDRLVATTYQQPDITKFNGIQVVAGKGVTLPTSKPHLDAVAHDISYYFNANTEINLPPVGPLQDIPSGSFQQLRLNKDDENYKLMPLRYSLGISIGPGFYNGTVGNVSQIAMQYQLSPKSKWSTSVGWIFFTLSNDDAINWPNGQNASTVRLLEYENTPAIGVCYQHYYSATKLIGQGELGVLPKGGLGSFARVSIAHAKYPWLRLQGGVYMFQANLTRRTFSPFSLTASQWEEKQKVSILSIGLECRFKL